jgi:DnaK suppressor protein
MGRLDIGQLRKKLEAQRKEVLQFLRQLDEETRTLDLDEATQDPADRCVTSISKESLFEQSSQRRTILRLIEAALQRIEDGSFGTCAGCEYEIPARRLQALPWTQFCLRCQEAIEEEVGSSQLSRSFSGPATTWKRTG